MYIYKTLNYQPNDIMKIALNSIQVSEKIVLQNFLPNTQLARKNNGGKSWQK